MVVLISNGIQLYIKCYGNFIREVYRLDDIGSSSSISLKFNKFLLEEILEELSNSRTFTNTYMNLYFDL